MDIVNQFAKTLNPDETEILTHVRRFIEWHVGSDQEFIPSSHDDVALRTYLMEMMMNGVRARSRREQMAALQLAHLSTHLAAFTQDMPPFDDITFFIMNKE